MISPEILAKGKYYKDQIFIVREKSSSRKIDSELEVRIDNLWVSTYKQAIENHKVLYDGNCFRLEEIDQKNKQLILHVSDFKFSKNLPLVMSADVLEGMGKEYYSNMLAIGGFLRTKDNKYIFGVRGDSSYSKYHIDFIGGVVEGMNLRSGEDLFSKLYGEIEEETGVLRTNIVDSYIVGVARSHYTDILVTTYTDIDLTAIEVEELFLSRADDEMQKLAYISANELNGFLKELDAFKGKVGELLGM